MDIVIALVIGAVAGFLAVLAMYRTIPNTSFEWLGAVVVGVLGGWFGSWLTDLAGLEAVNWLGALLIAFVFAVLILLLLQRLAPARR